ncbi:MAG: DUF420 domain-containing protein [Flavobacteriales bacterium]|nr:DUF420 domain-containing protein [Flavobacteriales bacterium]
MRSTGSLPAWSVALISLVLLGVVALLYLGPEWFSLSLDKGFLPRINAYVNGSTALVLVAAFLAVRRGNIPRHRMLMLVALGLSVLFLVIYVLQHSSFPSTSYAGNWPTLYYFTLISHIVLAAVIVPLVLITLSRALAQRFDKHRRIARITLPLWLYVSVSGVVVYVMISPFY